MDDKLLDCSSEKLMTGGCGWGKNRGFQTATSNQLQEKFVTGPFPQIKASQSSDNYTSEGYFLLFYFVI